MAFQTILIIAFSSKSRSTIARSNSSFALLFLRFDWQPQPLEAVVPLSAPSQEVGSLVVRCGTKSQLITLPRNEVGVEGEKGDREVGR